MEQGQIDVKDIREMLKMWKKANISYLELLYSNWIWVNPKYMRMYEIISMRDSIVSMNREGLFKSIKGMAYEKKKALCHSYPTIKWKIDKWGYDGKQLSHTARLHEWITRYLQGDFPKDCFNPISKNTLMRMKKQEGITKEEAIRWEDDIVQEIDNLINPVLDSRALCFHDGTWDLLQHHAEQIMLQRIKEEMKDYE